MKQTATNNYKNSVFKDGCIVALVPNHRGQANMVHHLDQEQGEQLILLPSRSSVLSSIRRLPSTANKFNCLMDKSNLKWISLIVLILQTTLLVLILHYSRVQKVDGPRYEYGF